MRRNLRLVALLSALSFPLALLAALFGFMKAQAYQPKDPPVEIETRLWLDASGVRPVLTYTLIVTAQVSWEGWKGFEGLTPSTQAYTDTLISFLNSIGASPVLLPRLYYSAHGPTPFGESGMAALRFTQTWTVKNLAAPPYLTQPYQYRAEPQEDGMTIDLIPANITSSASLVAYLHLKNVIIKHSNTNIPSDDLYHASDLTEENLNYEVSLHAPAGSERPQASVSVSLRNQQAARLLLGDYNVSASPPVTVTTSITQNAVDLRSGYPAVTTTLEIQAPRDWPGVEELLAISQRDRANYKDTLSMFLKGLGFWDEYQRRNLVDAPHELPKIEINERIVRFTIISPQEILFLGSPGRTISDPIGGFSEGLAGNDLLIQFSQDKVDLLPWVTWIIDVDLRGLSMLAVSPMPTSDNALGHLTWVVPRGSPRPGISIRTPVPLQHQLQAYLNNVNWIQELINPFLSAIVILAAISLLPGKRAPAEHNYPARAPAVRRILIWVLAILLGGDVLNTLVDPTIRFLAGYTNQAVFTQLIPVLIQAIAPLALVIFTLYAAWEARRSKAVHWLTLAFASASLVILLALQSMGPFYLISLTYLQIAILLLPIQALFIVLFTAFVLTGVTLLFIALLPEGSYSQVMERLHLNRRRLRVFLWLLVSAILLQWSYHAVLDLPGGESLPGVFGALLNFRSGINLDLDQQNTLHYLSLVLSYYPTNLASQVMNLLRIFALVGLSSLLFQSAGSATSVVFTSGQDWIKRIACLLFAGFVVSKSVSIIGFLIPLGFLLAWYLLPRLLSDKLEAAEGWIEANNPADNKCGSTRMVCGRKEFIKRAKAIVDLDAQFGELHSEYSKNKIDEEAYEQRTANLKSEIAWLQNGGVPDEAEDQPKAQDTELARRLDWIRAMGRPAAPPKTTKLKPQALIPLPDGISPRDLALGMGAMANWWQNGLLAIKLGAILSLIPVGYYVYVLITDRAKIMLTTYTFGVLSMFIGLMYEIAFWLVAAFVMGMLYPYLRGHNGMIKGAFLASIYALTMAIIGLVMMIFNLGSGSFWFFRALQLFLFLVVLGVWIDWHTLRQGNFYRRQLLDHYNLRDMRTLLSYLSPLTLALLGIAQQIVSGAASQSIVAELIKSLPAAIPNIP